MWKFILKLLQGGVVHDSQQIYFLMFTAAKTWNPPECTLTDSEPEKLPLGHSANTTLPLKKKNLVLWVMDEPEVIMIHETSKEVTHTVLCTGANEWVDLRFMVPRGKGGGGKERGMAGLWEGSSPNTLVWRITHIQKAILSPCNSGILQQIVTSKGLILRNNLILTSSKGSGEDSCLSSWPCCWVPHSSGKTSRAGSELCLPLLKPVLVPLATGMVLNLTCSPFTTEVPMSQFWVVKTDVREKWLIHSPTAVRDIHAGSRAIPGLALCSRVVSRCA